MIKQLSSRANTDEIIGTATMVFDVVDKSNYKNEGLSNLNKLLGNENNDLTIAQNRKRKNDETNEVSEARRLRIRAFSSFSHIAQSLKLRADNVLSVNGEIINEVIKRHGTGFSNMAGKEQTAKIKSLKSEMETPKVKVAIEACGVSVNLEELIKADEFYQEKVSKQTENSAAEKEMDKVTELRKSTKQVFDQLINYLNALTIIDNSDELKEPCNKISIIIDKANSTIQARLTRNNHDDNNEDDSDDDDIESTNENEVE